MLLSKRLGLTVAVALAVVLAGCNRGEPTSAGSAQVAAPVRSAAQIAQPAWLRERLPKHTVAYMRIPSFWGLMSAPNGRPLDAALGSAEHARLIGDLRDALRKDPTLAATGMAPALNLLLGDLAAPVEVAVIDGSDIANPASNFLISAQLDVADIAALNARIEALGTGTSMLKAPLDANGKAALAQNGFVVFDPASHRLHALLGMAASAYTLDALVKELAETRSHPMHEAEMAIDSGGQGLFFWMSLKGVTGMALAQMPKDPSTALVRDFVEKSASIAAGWGTHNGRGTFRMTMDAPAARLLSYIAPASFKTSIRTAGKPSWAVTMALPTAAQWTALESHLADDFGAEVPDQYRAAMDKMREATGVTLKDVMGLLGPELVAFEDSAGTFTAVRVGDRSALYTRLDDLGKRFGWRRETLQSGKSSLQHLYIPGINLNKVGQTDSDDKAQAWMTLYSRIGRHLYWQEEGDFLVFGQVPQSLADRAGASNDTGLDDWLTGQSYDAANTLVGATGVTHNVQRTVYYAYLSGLQALADAVGQTIDLAGLPSASKLQLPTDGVMAISVDANTNQLGFGLTYEQTPVEIVLGSGGGAMTGIAVVGILAAIAVPAYQDYVVRAQASSVLASVSAYKLAITEYYMSSGRLPGSATDLDLEGLGDSEKYLDEYQIDDGAIVLNFGDQAGSSLNGTTLVLRPYLINKSVGWQCGYAALPDAAKVLSDSAAETTTASKLLPSSCR